MLIDGKADLFRRRSNVQRFRDAISIGAESLHAQGRCVAGPFFVAVLLVI